MRDGRERLKRGVGGLRGRRPRLLLLVLPLLLIGSPVVGAPAKAEEASRELAERFFRELEKGDVSRASDAIALEFPLSDPDRDRFRKRLKALLVQAGPLESWRLHGVEPFPGSSRLYRVKLLSYHANRPVGWMLAFYRLKGAKWSVLDLAFDADDVFEFLKVGAGPKDGAPGRR